MQTDRPGSRLGYGESAQLVRLRPWADDDLPLLERLLGDPEMTVHIGGPETPEQLHSRHERYLACIDPSGDGVFAVAVGPEGTPAGWVGYWDTEWQGQQVWEVGWSILPEFQGRGIATAATSLAIDRARQTGGHRYMHAFPSVGNAASNAVCRKLGFEPLGEVDFEYPPGHVMKAKDWRLDLLGETTG